MKKPTQHRTIAVLLTVVCAALTASISKSQAQVTYSQVTNGLVDFYPLDNLTPGSPGTTPDLISRRDLILSPATSGANIIASTHSGGGTTNCFNLNQSGGATVLYYVSTGQNPVDGSGDFLPFCNQHTATMNFWLKRNASGPTAGDQRFFGEADNTGGIANPLWLIGTSSGTPDTAAHWLMRQQDASGPEGETTLMDGTLEFPVLGTRAQADHSTSTNFNPVLDGNWHMFTVTKDTNGSYSVYVDGVLDVGPANSGAQQVDFYGNNSTLEYLWETNFYYTTNVYPAAGVSNPPPNGFVQWVFNAMFKNGATAFGGFKRGGITGGFSVQIDDIGFWNRALSSNEVVFVMTNGIPNLTLNTNVMNVAFAVDLTESEAKDQQVHLSWNVTGASPGAGGIVITGVGDVSGTPVGSANVTLGLRGTTATYTLTAHNGVVADIQKSVSVKSFGGVASNWHLIQRFDGVFSDSTVGVAGNGWVSAQSDFNGNKDRFNTLTLNNNRLLTPKSGYSPNNASAVGVNSPGAMAYGLLGSALTIPPFQSNTLFFRFSLQEAIPVAGFLSDIDCAIGISDENFISPLGGGAGPGNYGNVGAFISIIRNGGGTYNGGVFDLKAQDYDGSSVSNGFSYTNSVDPNGLQTNVVYSVWMDIQNKDTHSVTNPGVSTNTVNEALYSVWIQKQGDANRTLLFSDFRANRDYVGYNPVNDLPTPFLNKVFVSIADENITAAPTPPGAYFATNTANMIAIDDIYLSKTGLASTTPKLFDMVTVVRGTTNASVTWDSLGSMFGPQNTYSVQRTLSLSPPSWVTLTNGLPSGGDTTTFNDTTVGAATQAFYRVSQP